MKTLTTEDPAEAIATIRALDPGEEMLLNGHHIEKADVPWQSPALVFLDYGPEFTEAQLLDMLGLQPWQVTLAERGRDGDPQEGS